MLRSVSLPLPLRYITVSVTVIFLVNVSENENGISNGNTTETPHKTFQISRIFTNLVRICYQDLL